jgi:signal transduction histidine kinase
VYVTGVAVGGVPAPVAERGAAAVTGLVLPAADHALRIEYGAVAFPPARYRYRLDGADAAWSAPTAETSVHYPRLGPGSYRFTVQALDADGGGGDPAVVAFAVPAPVWRRPWFAALAALALAAAGFALHRARVRRLLALERIRSQIATDLHDDVGAGLSQIAIVAETGRREAPPAAERVLADVAELARGMRNAMDDIVWAVDPRRDRLVDLVRRARAVAGQLFEPDGVALRFEAPAEAEMDGVALEPRARRHLWLWLKEALVNAARHARARSVGVSIALGGGELRFVVEDDGCGLAPGAGRDGHGLRSLQQRAAALRGTCSIAARPGGGTRVALSVPRG